MPSLRPAERIGSVLGERYRIDGVLGSGGMALVFGGTDLRTERPVALKVLHTDVLEDAMAVRRFLREARTAASLHHPHIVDVLDMGETEDGAPYLVLELLRGEALLERLKRGPLAVGEALETLLPIMDALVHAHAAGVVHRDIKPANLFLHRNRRGAPMPKLVDFGISKLLAANVSVPTATGTIIGTPQYMSPEQVQASKSIGPQTDVWSIGAVLFEALSGRRAFDGAGPMVVILTIVTGVPPALADVAPHVPAPIAAVVDRSLTKSLDERYASMEVMQTALVQAARDAGVPLSGPAPSD